MEATSISLNPPTVARISLDSPQPSSEDEEICKFSSYKKAGKFQRKPNPQRQRMHSTPKSGRCSGCGGSQHGNGDRSLRCPAWNRTCNNCGKKGHFSKVCRSEKSEHANAVIAEIAPHANNKNNEVRILMSPVSKSSKPAKEIEISVFADTGASLCVTGLSILKLLGIKLSQLKGTSKRIVTATGNKIHCRGWFNARLTLNNHTTLQSIYVCDSISRVYLSKNGCIELGIVHKGFPSQMENFSKPKSMHSNSPTAPLKMPYPPTAENVPLLKDYLLKTFADTAFNNDKSQFFPKMLGVPPAHIHLKPNSEPCIRPVPNHIPHYWKASVKKLLDEHEKRGIIAKTPIGIPTPWCSPMVITPKKGNLLQPKLRMTIDLQKLNSQCQREIHHVESPFKLVSQFPK